MELRCYEDSDFYNKYTMACDRAVDKISEIIKSFFGIFVGAVSAIVVFKFMFDIDHYSVLFILAPLIGNFKVFNLLRDQYKTATKNNVEIAGKFAFKNAHLNFWRITFTFSIIFEGMMAYGIYLFAVRRQGTVPIDCHINVV